MTTLAHSATPLPFGAKRGTRRSTRASPPRPAFLARRVEIDRKSLVLTTALTSMLVLASLLGSAPVAAADCAQPSSSLPIHDTQTAPITPRVNEGPLTNLGGDAIFLSTTGDGNFVDLTNVGGG